MSFSAKTSITKSSTADLVAPKVSKSEATYPLIRTHALNGMVLLSEAIKETLVFLAKHRISLQSKDGRGILLSRIMQRFDKALAAKHLYKSSVVFTKRWHEKPVANFVQSAEFKKVRSLLKAPSCLVSEWGAPETESMLEAAVSKYK